MLGFTCGERKVSLTIKKSQNMNLIVGPEQKLLRINGY